MAKTKEAKMVFDGFGAAIDLLRHSDKATREKILRNVAARDPALAARLLNATNEALTEQHYMEARAELNRSQRKHNVKNYGSK